MVKCPTLNAMYFTVYYYKEANFICAAENQFASYIVNFFFKKGPEKCLWYPIIYVKRSNHIHISVHMLRIDMNNSKGIGEERNLAHLTLISFKFYNIYIILE